MQKLVPKPKPSFLFNAREGNKDGMAFVVHGPPGHGKTWAAASSSHFWAEKKPLEDQLWIVTEQGALSGLLAKGIEIPYCVDTPYLLRHKHAAHILDALNIIYSTIQQALIDHPSIKYVIVDTISALDDRLVSYWDQNCPITKAGNKNTIAMWMSLQATHTKFFEAISMLPCHQIFLCHSKALDTENMDKAQINRIRVNSTPGKGDLVPQITGQSLNLYTKNATIEMSIEAKTNPQTRQLERILTTEGGTYRTKNRLKDIVPDMMKADMRELFDIIGKSLNFEM